MQHMAGVVDRPMRPAKVVHLPVTACQRRAMLRGIPSRTRRSMHSRQSDKRLFIADLAQRLANMECGRVPMHPLMYRVLATRLRQAVAGFTDSALAGQFGPLNGQVTAVLEDRHFNCHGHLDRPCALQVRRAANDLFSALGVRALSPGRADLR
jgi:hypothetical protein